MSEIEGFFRKISQLWDEPRPEKVVFKVIGSGALFLQTDYRRATKDGDILETLQVTPELKETLTKLAGKRTALHKSTGLYLDLVSLGLPFLPHGPRFHPQKKLSEDLKNFSVEALDIVDVVVSKLKRFNASDSEDVNAMIERGLVPHAALIERFAAAVDEYSTDSRLEDVPKYVRNLHRVERDMFHVPESQIDMPDWMG